MHQRAEAYPDIWYGIWSGPDSFNAFYADRPGETFNWSVTPMTDFPVMNMNRHSGPLLDVIRLCGIDPAGPSIRISPKLPFDQFCLKLPLIGVAYLPDRHRGFYRPVAAGSFPFEIKLPGNLDCDNFQILVQGVEREVSCRDGHVAFEVAAQVGDAIRWEILPSSSGSMGGSPTREASHREASALASSSGSRLRRRPLPGRGGRLAGTRD